MRAAGLAKDAEALKPEAAAERAGYNAKLRQNAAYDLVDAVKQKKVDLEKLKKEELPAEMQKMTLAEQKAHLAKLDKDRETLQKEALDLDKKRADYITKKTAESSKNNKSAFDKQVLEILRKQAKKVKVEY
jgi:hypothetical protein